MKRTLGWVAICGVVLAAVGCETTGLSGREQRGGYAAVVNSWYQGKPERGAPRPIRKPIRLAVAQVGETAPESILLTGVAMDSNLVGKVVTVPLPGREETAVYARQSEKEDSSKVIASQLESARNLARDLGAEYMLVLGGTIDSYNSRTIWSPLDVTIVAGAITPGMGVNVEGKATGALLDIETGRILFVSNAAIKTAGLSPSFFADEKRNVLRADAREKLSSRLAEDFVSKLKDYTN